MTYHFSPDVRALNPELEAEVKASQVTPSKYHNVRTEARGMTFQSGHEASVIGSLILLEEQKKIFALRLQVRFPLSGDTVYVADAVYLDEKLESHIIDAKPLNFQTKEFKIKRRLFKEKYGRDIELV